MGKIKGWPPPNNNAKAAGRGLKGPGQCQNGGMNADSKRPSSDEMWRGTPASDSFRFPTSPKMDTKETND